MTLTAEEKRPAVLDEQALEGVTGGTGETDAGAAGYVCPMCGTVLEPFARNNVICPNAKCGRQFEIINGQLDQVFRSGRPQRPVKP